jgi:hypothetical protein
VWLLQQCMVVDSGLVNWGVLSHPNSKSPVSCRDAKPPDNELQFREDNKTPSQPIT